MKTTLKYGFIFGLLFLLGGALTYFNFGFFGLFGEHVFARHPVLMMSLYFVVAAHLTITSMSLCMHRMHTHRGVIFRPWVDRLMQTWLWAFTSISKRDWVSVHVFHHAHSDQDLDPHSPVKKGFWHVFLLGVWDYNKAKYDPEVIKIRKRIPESPYEQFIAKNAFFAPIILSSACLIFFGPVLGTIMSFLNFSIAPFFAIGGVNGLAHFVGYRNYQTTDNSRNIGFLLPLNWIICGELDHNNHHAHQRSCSFRHRWFEFDIGYLYIQVFKFLRLAEVKTVYRSRKKQFQSQATEMADQLADQIEQMGADLQNKAKTFS